MSRKGLAAMLTAVAEERVTLRDTAPETTTAAVDYAVRRLERGLDAPLGSTRAELAHCRFHVALTQVYGDDHRAMAAAVDDGLVELTPIAGSDTDHAARLTAAGWARLEEEIG